MPHSGRVRPDLQVAHHFVGTRDRLDEVVGFGCLCCGHVVCSIGAFDVSIGVALL